MKRDIKYSKLGIRVASQVAERLKEILRKSQIWVETVKKHAKVDIKLSCPVQFYWISLFCSKYFAQDCLSKQIFGLNSAQSSSNF